MIKNVIDSISENISLLEETNRKFEQVIRESLKVQCKQPDEFNGNDDNYDIIDFLESFDRYCQFYNVENKYKSNLFATFLGQSPLKAYECLKKEIQDDFNLVRQYFLKEYMSWGQRYLRKQKLYKRKMGLSESVRTYFLYLHREAMKLEVSDSEVQYIFINGLPKKIQKHVLLQTPSNLQAAFKAALAKESEIDFVKQEQEKSSSERIIQVKVASPIYRKKRESKFTEGELSTGPVKDMKFIPKGKFKAKQIPILEQKSGRDNVKIPMLFRSISKIDTDPTKNLFTKRNIISHSKITTNKEHIEIVKPVQNLVSTEKKQTKASEMNKIAESQNKASCCERGKIKGKTTETRQRLEMKEIENEIENEYQNVDECLNLSKENYHKIQDKQDEQPTLNFEYDKDQLKSKGKLPDLKRYYEQVKIKGKINETTQGLGVYKIENKIENNEKQNADECLNLSKGNFDRKMKDKQDKQPTLNFGDKGQLKSDIKNSALPANEEEESENFVSEVLLPLEKLNDSEYPDTSDVKDSKNVKTHNAGVSEKNSKEKEMAHIVKEKEKLSHFNSSQIVDEVASNFGTERKQGKKTEEMQKQEKIKVKNEIKIACFKKISKLSVNKCFISIFISLLIALHTSKTPFKTNGNIESFIFNSNGDLFGLNIEYTNMIRDTINIVCMAILFVWNAYRVVKICKCHTCGPGKVKEWYFQSQKVLLLLKAVFKDDYSQKERYSKPIGLLF